MEDLLLQSIPQNTHLQVNWPSRQAVNLGNLLTFRKELEMLIEHYQVAKITMTFGLSKDEFNKLPQPLQQLLLDYVTLQHTEHEKSIWPPSHKEVLSWNYGSFKRLALLHKLTGISYHLRWAEKDILPAKECLNRIKAAGYQQAIAVHLKRQAGGREMSNASLVDWEKLFRHAKNVAFILLGLDEVGETIESLPNVFVAKQWKLPLSSELAFCDLCDGFLGMASGVSAAAVLGPNPYVLFKHPSHHIKEMQTELGELNHLTFAQPNQLILRKIDSFENLKCGLATIL